MVEMQVAFDGGDVCQSANGTVENGFREKIRYA